MIKIILKELKELPIRIDEFKLYTFDELEETPEEPGIYLVYFKDQAIYIGTSGDLQNRLTNFMRELQVDNEVSTYHIGAFSLKEYKKLPNKIKHYKFKFIKEKNQNKYLLFERFLIYLHSPLLNKK